MFNKNLISIKDLNKNDIDTLFLLASKGKSIFSEYNNTLKNKILGSIFFQSSTRTQFSFQTAFLRLGGNYIGCNNINQIRCGPPYYESTEDFAQIINSYCDIVVMRTQNADDTRIFDNNLSIPFISAGSGNNEHPTQALIDLFTIDTLFNGVDSQTILIIGTPRQRAINSLLLGLALWKNIKVYFLCPKGIDLFPSIKNNVSNIEITFFHSWEELFSASISFDISTIYIGEIVYDDFPTTNYILTKKILDSKFSKDVQILSPLPRTTELAKSVDSHKGAKYFFQAQLGLYLRASLFLNYFI